MQTESFVRKVFLPFRAFNNHHCTNKYILRVRLDTTYFVEN